MIAITPWRRPLATSAHPRQDLYTINPDYLVGVERAGTQAALVGHVTTVEEATAVLARFDGLIISGGADVDPSMYGAENAGSVETDRSADVSDIAYLRAAERLGMPVLAICRGMQIMNVAYGGTMHQHIWGRAQHPAKLDTGNETADAEEFLARRHDVELTPGSRIEGLFGTTTLRANSLHHQAVDEIAADLVITATTADGTVEGLEHPTAPVLGVQWHPERMLDEGHQVLFDWLVRR